MASLVADLGKDDFKKLAQLWLFDNQLTDAGIAKLATAIDRGALPRLVYDRVFLRGNHAASLNAPGGD